MHISERDRSPKAPAAYWRASLVTAQNQFLNVQNAAIYTGLSEATIRNLVTRGTIPVKRLGHRILIERQLLDSLIRSHGETGAGLLTRGGT